MNDAKFHSLQRAYDNATPSDGECPCHGCRSLDFCRSEDQTCARYDDWRENN